MLPHLVLRHVSQNHISFSFGHGNLHLLLQDITVKKLLGCHGFAYAFHTLMVGYVGKSKDVGESKSQMFYYKRF